MICCHATELAGLPRELPCQLIAFNPVPGVPFQPSTRLEHFQKQLTQAGLNVTIRRSIGQEIDAACGQLRKGFCE